MGTNCGWFDNNYEGKLLRRIIQRLAGRFEKLSCDENSDLQKLQELAKTIGYLAVQKNVLLKTTIEPKKEVSLEESPLKNIITK